MPKTRAPRRSRTARNMMEAAAKGASIPAECATVLSHRLPLLLNAATDTRLSTVREQQRMVTEKVTAGMQVGQVAANASWKMLTTLAAGGTKLAHSWGQPAAFANAWLSLATAAADVLAAAARAGVTPVHGKVRANAKRLSRRKRH